VDILPTLLDAMHIPYNPMLLNGESLFLTRLKRKYIFVYGFEKSISSMSADMIKITFSLENRQCRAFDLKSDPGEIKALKCDQYAGQLNALFNFANFQNTVVEGYNSSIAKKTDFNGQRLPEMVYACLKKPNINIKPKPAPENKEPR
jgi:hypothetical protein